MEESGIVVGWLLGVEFFGEREAEVGKLGGLGLREALLFVGD